MKKYVSVHYENFKSSSEISHNMRTQKEPDHLLKLEDRLPNVLDLEAKSKYEKLLNEAKELNKRSFQKTAKPNVDMVMSWSWDKVKQNIEKFGIEKYNKMLSQRIEEFGKRIENEFGLKFVSFNIHNDEGHYKNNEAILNQHSHITFLDFDFNKKQRVIRTLSKYDLKKWQQISEDCFQDLDFEQGKNKTKQKHIEAKQYGKLQDKLNNEIDELETEVENLSIQELEKLKIKYKNDKLKKRLIDYVYRFKKAEQQAKDNTKTYSRIINTWEKIQNDGMITKDEQTQFTKLLKAVGAKNKAKSVSTMKTKN